MLSLSNGSIKCITRDNFGGMWIGTYFGGVNYYYPNRIRFHVLDTGDNPENNIMGGMAISPDGSILIGTNRNGLFCYEPQLQRNTVLQTGELDIKDIVVSAEYIDEDCNIRTINAEDMELSYRRSFFSGSERVITSVTMELKKGNPEEIKNAMSECMAKRSAKQPLDYPSAGSTFKRPEGSYASLLIEQCGLKGLTCGGAMVSEKHSGFVINKGYATCADVLELCDKVRAIVKEKTGYLLELEPVILR